MDRAGLASRSRAAVSGWLRSRRLAGLALAPLMLAAPVYSAVPAYPAAPGGGGAWSSCGSGATWSVKTGTDSQARQVDLSSPPTKTTVQQLTNLPLPSPIVHRVQPTEFTVYTITTTLVDSYQEHDLDDHLAVNEGGTRYMITELPDLSCVPTSSPFYAGISRAHRELAAWNGTLPMTVQITGVGFFDGYTGQSDQALNQIELHPILDLNFSPASTSGAVAGTVASATNGAAIAAATVRDSSGATTSTDPAGAYTLAGLSIGTHTLTASAAGFSSQSVTASVAAGETTHNVNFHLQPAGPPPPLQLVQAAGATESAASSSTAVTLTTPSVSGHLLVVSAGVYTGATNQITSVTDSAGDQWTKVGAFSTAGHYSDGEMWYAANADSVTRVTVNTASAALKAVEVLEFAGVDTIAPLDISAGTSNTGTSPAAGPVSPAVAGELVVGFIAGHSNTELISVTASGYTTQPQQTSAGGGSLDTSVVTGYRVAGSTSTQSFTGALGASMYWASGIACFRAGT